MATRKPLVLATGRIQQLQAADILMDGRGGAITIPYQFSTTTTDTDPGNGFLRLDNATQNLSTVIRADLLDLHGADWTDVLDTLNDGTAVAKGYIRLVHASDHTKWIVFQFTAVQSPAGYRNIVVSVVASSAASPFANNDLVLLCADAGVTDALIRLTEDKDIFVRTTGNDTTGDGSAGAPFLTIERAVTEFSKFAPGQETITIDIGEGEFPLSESLRIVYPYGGSLEWHGVVEDHTGITFGNYDVAATPDADIPALQWYECDATLPSGTATVGQFLIVKTATGGTNPTAVLGVHEITAVAGSVLTIRVSQRLNVPELPTGAITGDGTVLKTSITSAFTPGLHGKGAINVGLWNDLMFLSTNLGVGSAVQMESTAAFRTDQNFAAHGWVRGLYSVRNSVIDCTQVFISRMATEGVRAEDAGFVRPGTSAIINGCGTQAVNCVRGSQAICQQMTIHSSGDARAIIADDKSYVDAVNITIAYDDGSGTAFVATDGSYINATNATVTGYATTKNPSENPDANWSIIVGSPTITPVTFNDAGADQDFRVEGDTLTHMIFCDASAATENIALVTTAIPNWQSMDRGLFIGDSSAAPSGNPSAGVFMYCTSADLFVRNGVGAVTQLSGVTRGATASVADGGTITHNLGSTPVVVLATGSVAGEIVSVTAIGATTFTVAIKLHDGTAGTSQTIYWQASES